MGVNAELLIDHAWGYEPCTIAEIKAYKPENSSTSSGQVLQSPYPYKKALIVIKEMAELALNLVEKGLVTDQLLISFMMLKILNTAENTAAKLYPTDTEDLPRSPRTERRTWGDIPPPRGK